MKKQSLTGLALVALTGTLLSSCDLLKDLEYTVTPSPLEMHGDSVRVKVDVKFPEKGIRKKVSAEIQPMLGETALKPITVQGEKATGNGTVIQFKPGGQLSYYDIVPYQSSYEVTELNITGKIFKGTKEKDALGPIKIADGTIITPLLVNKDFKVVLEKDNFKRVTEKSYMATINFDKGKFNVKPNELKDKDIIDLENWLRDVEGNDKVQIKAINITGYASPEGEEDKNNTLSTDRSNSGKTVTLNLAKKANNAIAQTEIYNLVGKGEDYPGFKAELEKSKMNEDEKNLVIRVLEMHKDPVTREQEMRNMGKTFTYLDNNIFPKLRRAEIKVVYDKVGYSDEELKTIGASKPEQLDLEEMLFAATLVDNNDTKLKIYKAAVAKYPTDHRAFNNAGAVYYWQGNMAEAKAMFEKANNIKDNNIAKNNLGAIAGAAGDRKEAAKLLAQGKGSGAENGYNWAILNILDGKYAEAVSNAGGDASFNKALAQMLNGSAETAIKTINQSADKESAQGYYLKAIACARLDKAAEAAAILKNAISKDSAWKAKAAKDREFLKYAEESSFTALF
ncbi:MAG: tetratricopeptide repeat protein [Crocinitomicaceae bacterium]|jgi:tetratricopeptide (TPR) repeat protein|nr:tetratricopeptide repeat protein [Crocinitomicaceae bacterium]